MARKIRSSEIETRTQRLELTPRRKPYFVRLNMQGLNLGYRKPKGQVDGTWVMRTADGKGGLNVKAIGHADDYQPSNGDTILTYDEATTLARKRFSGEDGGTGGGRNKVTVGGALDGLEADYKRRGGDVASVQRVRRDLTPRILNSLIQDVKKTEWRKWRDDLAGRKCTRRRGRVKPVIRQKGGNVAADDTRSAMQRLLEDGRRAGDRIEVCYARQRPCFLKAQRVGYIDAKGKLTEAGLAYIEPGVLTSASVNRITTTVKAALNRVADLSDEGINRHPWEVGLATIEGSANARNVIIEDEDDFNALVNYSYEEGEDLGLLTHTCAESGARPIAQVAKLLVANLIGGDNKPILMMPVSRKGKGKKKKTHIATSISTDLYRRLKKAAKGRKPTERLLLMASGKPWGKSKHSYPFQRAVRRAGLTGRGITMYAFRHTSIVRQLLDNVPTRVVATYHDTSVPMIEKNYSVHISDLTDDLTRKSLPALKIAA
jgi:hypothetical protein